jgi:selenocysteine lyase/cysteine desulfurase
VSDRTRVLFFSHITSPTAFSTPVAELVRRARAAGIITWNRENLMRISVQGYSTQGDLDALVEALALLLPEAAK